MFYNMYNIDSEFSIIKFHEVSWKSMNMEETYHTRGELKDWKKWDEQTILRKVLTDF